MNSKFGIFLLPDKKVEKFIFSQKEVFKSIVKSHKYLDHLVHLTLFVFDANNGNKNKILHRFNSLKINENKILVDTIGWKIFKNDFLTKLNTLYLEIEKSDELSKLQEILIATFKEFAIKKIDNNLGSEFNKNKIEFGSPYVRDLWVPHITVGSLDIDENQIFNQIKRTEIEFKDVSFKNISLYKIDGDKHTELCSIKLN